MGQEIPTSLFTPDDFSLFLERLKRETALLNEWFTRDRFKNEGCIAGFELEAWLVHRNGLPAAINEQYLDRLNSDLVTPELSKFNIELNTDPLLLRNDVLSGLERSLQDNWNHCYSIAESLDVDLAMIGILPSLTESDLTIENMSELQRYHALNEQVFAMRKGLPLTLNIVGEDHLKTTHYNVMLEASTTSFQIHLQVDPKKAVRFYNASLLASAITVAASANSPFLFGHALWDETRIPLFEQAVEVGGYEGAVFGPTRRVGFGTAYAKQSLFEFFQENLNHFPVMLPISFDNGEARLEHLRLHNGTIWRWNRPLIGFDDRGNPTIRLEHRVVPGGPTIIDMIANTALYYGLTYYLACMTRVPEQEIPFAQARDNFYQAAKRSLQAPVQWLDERRVNLRELLLNELIDMARVGLGMLSLDSADIDKYLKVIEQRAESGQHGAAWQRAYVNRHGKDMIGLTQAYIEQQQSGQPVHSWVI